MGIDRDRDGEPDADGFFGCPAAPGLETGSCTALPSGAKAGLLLKDTAPLGLSSIKDRIAFKLFKGPAILQADFGVPTNPNAGEHHFCFYQQPSGGQVALGLEFTAPASGFTPISDKGWKYVDGPASVDGIKRIVEKGGSAGKSMIMLSAKGLHLPNQFVPLIASALTATRLLVELHNDDNQTCVGVEFDTATDLIKSVDKPGKLRMVKFKHTE